MYDGVSEEELQELNQDVQPVRLVLVKICCHHRYSNLWLIKLYMSAFVDLFDIIWLISWLCWSVAKTHLHTQELNNDPATMMESDSWRTWPHRTDDAMWCFNTVELNLWHAAVCNGLPECDHQDYSWKGNETTNIQDGQDQMGDSWSAEQGVKGMFRACLLNMFATWFNHRFSKRWLSISHEAVHRILWFQPWIISMRSLWQMLLPQSTLSRFSCANSGKEEPQSLLQQDWSCNGLPNCYGYVSLSLSWWI